MILPFNEHALLQKTKTSASAEPRFFLSIIGEGGEKKNRGYAQADARSETLVIGIAKP
jgi:hypothetical protein